MFVHALPTLPEHVRNRQTVVSVGSWASGTSWWFWDGNFTLKILQSSINPLVPNTTVPSTYLWFHVKEKYSFILIKPPNASSAGLTENVEQPWIAHGSAWKWSDHNMTFDTSHEPEDTKQMTPPRDNKGSEYRVLHLGSEAGTDWEASVLKVPLLWASLATPSQVSSCFLTDYFWFLLLGQLTNADLPQALLIQSL